MTKKSKFELLVILILFVGFLLVVKEKLAVFFYNQGCDYYGRALYPEAVSYFKNSLRISPGKAVSHYMLGSSLIENKRRQEGIEEYGKAIRAQSGYIPAYMALAQVYLADQQYEQALQEARKAAAIDKHNQEAEDLSNRISFAYAVDRLDIAIDNFLLNKKEEAYALLNKALEIRPDFAYTYYALAFFYAQDNMVQEAKDSLLKATQIDAQFWPAYQFLGDIYFQQGSFLDAAEAYKKALVFNKTDASLYNDLGLALMQAEHYREATPYLEEALKLSPDNLNFRYSLASTYRDNRDFDKAIAEYRIILASQDNYPDIYNDLGDIYSLQNKKSEAIKAYRVEIQNARKALSVNPNDHVALNNLARALNGTGDSEQAKGLIQKVLAMQPEYREAYITLSKINEKMGNTQEALAALKKANTLFFRANFIERDIRRIKKDYLSATDAFQADTIYLKNGRQIRGRIKQEDTQRVVLEVKLTDNTVGTLTFDHSEIEQVIKNSPGN